MKTTSCRVGVDMGGTFADVVLETRGHRFSTKVLTTHGPPEDAIIDGPHQVCQQANVAPSDIFQRSQPANARIRTL